MGRRDYISLKVKLAAALLTMRRPDDKGELVPVILPEDAKQMTADQIISVFHFDHHPVPKAFDGPDEPWNLQPRPLVEHREKTRREDVPRIAKTKRLSAAQEEFQRKVLARPCGAKRERSKKWPSRPMRTRRKKA